MPVASNTLSNSASLKRDSMESAGPTASIRPLLEQTCAQTQQGIISITFHSSASSYKYITYNMLSEMTHRPITTLAFSRTAKFCIPSLVRNLSLFLHTITTCLAFFTKSRWLSDILWQLILFNTSTLAELSSHLHQRDEKAGKYLAKPKMGRAPGQRSDMWRRSAETESEWFCCGVGAGPQ